MTQTIRVGFALALAGAIPVVSVAFADARPPAPVRDRVALSDRWSAAFFEVARDGSVVTFADFPWEGRHPDHSLEKPLFKLPDASGRWSWREGYLPVLSVGTGSELVASGDELFVRIGDAYTRWPSGRAATKAEFDLAAERVCASWRRWFAAGRELPPVDARTDAAWRSCLVQALCTYAGRHPHYGPDFYRVLLHDAFPPTTLATVETLVLFGHEDEAADIFLYYLDRYVKADGAIEYYGPSLSEYGAMMGLGARMLEAVPARADEIAAKLRPLVRYVLGWFQLRSPTGSLGPNMLLAGVPEADTRGRGDEYFHNNFQVLRGLSLVGPAYAAQGEWEFAAEIRNVHDLFARILFPAFERKKRELGGLPFAMSQKEIPDDIQSSLDSGYANYRYYPELLEAGYADRADVEQYCRYRETHNGEYFGMTFLAVTNCAAEVDNWPIASYGRGLLEYGLTNRFDRVWKSHLDHYLSDDTFTAYEQIANAGNPRRPVAPGCVPVQLALPRMLAWRHFGYRPWRSCADRLVVSGLRGFKGGRDATGFTLCEEGEDVVFRFVVADATPCVRTDVSYKRDIESGDRVEVYFSATAELKDWYYGIEIDPLGHVLDYRVKYPRKFDYGWSCPTLRAKAIRRAGGYAVEGRIARSALAALGIDVRNCHLGVFRADCRAGAEEADWYSAVPFCAGEADFHQPKMFFPFQKGRCE